VRFLRYLLSWVSQNLAIPFWSVGHLHLAFNQHLLQDIEMIIASMGMNIIVATGFILDYRKHIREQDNASN
jgi:hypothetical protein